MKQTHLKSIKNGRVFLFSETLATRDDMVPCNAKGEIASGHIGDAESMEATQERRKTKYLGNVTNGVLYPYTAILAERADMVSIDTEEQWALMKQTGQAPEKDVNALQPKLDKEPASALTRQPKEPIVPSSAQGSGECSLPVIEGMGAREAKTTLSDWAKEKFNVTIDRRPQLQVVIDECMALAAKVVTTAKVS